MASALPLAAFSGALTKVLSASLSPFVTVWLRFTGSSLILIPVNVIRVKSRDFCSERSLFHIFCGIVLITGNASFVYGVKDTDYANEITILYFYHF